MTLRSGLGTQFGIKAESTYGTEVVVDKFIYINSESVKSDVRKIESAFLGNVMMRTSQVKTWRSGAAGDTVHPFFNKGMGTLLKQAFGASQTAQVASTAEYTHTFTPDITNGKQGVSASIQILKPNTEGALVNPYTAAGAKCTGFTIAMEAEGLLVLTMNWITADGDFATTLATASYPTNLEMFDWSDASITLDGSDFFARSFNIRGEWAFDVDRRGLSQTNRKEPILNAFPGFNVTGEMAGEFEDLTAYNAFAAGTQMELVATFEGSVIPTTSNPYKVVITCSDVELTGDTPVVGGPGILEQPAGFRALYNGTDPGIELVVHNDETTI